MSSILAGHRHVNGSLLMPDTVRISRLTPPSGTHQFVCVFTDRCHCSSLIGINLDRPSKTCWRCLSITLTALEVPAHPFEKFLSKIRSERRNGGAYLRVFQVGEDPVFDWLASRNRLWDDRLLDWLVLHPIIVRSFPVLRIPDSPREDTSLGMFDPFLFDSTFASLLYHGGAYTHLFIHRLDSAQIQLIDYL